jgi:hypothetical protein
VRAIIVVINFGLGGRAIYHHPEWLPFSESQQVGLLHARISTISLGSAAAVWNDANLGGADGLLLLLERFAR